MLASGCTLSSCKYDGISNPNFLYDADGNIRCVTTKTACDGYAVIVTTISSLRPEIEISRQVVTCAPELAPA